LGRALGILGAALGRIKKIKVIRIGAIIKKQKAKGKTAAKNTGKKKNAKKTLDPAEVRKNIAQMVDWEAAVMVQAVIDEGKKGQLATVKYLLEMAEIYPASGDGSQATAEEDSLAKTLLHRLNLPEEPIARDEEDEAEGKPKQDEGKACGAEPEGDDEGKDPVVG